jgi:hypothetical protein
MLKLKQWGYNPSYPIEAESWKFGEPVPGWLSDVARVLGFNSDGGIILETYKDASGKIHIKDTYRPIDIFVLPNEDAMIIYGEGKRLVIDETKLDLLYLIEGEK